MPVPEGTTPSRSTVQCGVNGVPGLGIRGLLLLWLLAFFGIVGKCRVLGPSAAL